ncbi:MAG: hypothetical protein V4689_06245 [Verrucomicrobiota bacterium]
MNHQNPDTEHAPSPAVSLLPYLILVATILLTYSNVFTTSYGFTDDYSFLHSTTSGNNDLTHLLITVGRPTQAGIIEVFFSMFSTVESLKHVRLLGILGTGLFACCLYRHIFRLTGKKGFATCAAFAICALPAFQVYVSWAQYFSMPYACIAAFFAYQAANRALLGTGALPRISFAMVSLVLLLLSLTVHPVAGFFYVFFLATELLHTDEDLKPAARRILLIMSIFMAGLVCSYILLKLGKHWFPASDTNRDGLTKDLIGKAKWFFKQPLYDALSGPFIPARKLVAAPVLAIIAFGMTVASGWKGLTLVRKAVIAAAFVPFVYLPNLMVTENWSSYRTQAVLSALVLYYLLFSINAIASSERWKSRSLETAALSACAAICVFFGWKAASNTHRYFTVPQAKEHQYVSTRLSTYDPSKHTGIHYIMSSRWDTLAPFAYYDEFGLPSGCQAWVPKPFVLSVLHDRKIPDLGRIKVEEIKPEAPLPEGGFLLDLRSIKTLD